VTDAYFKSNEDWGFGRFIHHKELTRGFLINGYLRFLVTMREKAPRIVK
jgi:hypothetical protein